MQLQVNGELRYVADNWTIAQLLSDLEVTTAHVAVEVNRQLVPRAEHDSHQLADGDQLEIVTLVGGG